MSKNRWLIDRRTCLRGLGVALALPLLDSMGWAEQPAKAASRPPVRLGFMYMPHGVIPERFWPKDQTSLRNETPEILAPLRPLLDQCLIAKGVSGVPIAPFNGAPHALELSTWLTATLPDDKRRNVVNIGISADQIAANYVGAFTPLPSLELATMPQTHKENQEGLHEIYYSHCSYRSPTQPVPAETNPRNVFKRLFQSRDRKPGQETGAAAEADELDRSMLDLVLGGAKNLRGTLGRSDQQKLDEYLDGVRSLERRIAAIEQHRQQAANGSSGAGAGQRRPGDSALIEVAIKDGKVKHSEYMQVMCDLTVLAFQSDATRVSTYIGSTPNGLSYPELGFSDQHHSQTHHNKEKVMVDKVARINTFLVEQFAYMVTKMSTLKEGEGTLLDNCLMMWGSGLEDGNRHTRDNLPFVIAGRGGGAFKTGRYLADLKGNQGDLLGTLLTAAGIPLDKPIGIGTKVFREMLTA